MSHFLDRGIQSWREELLQSSQEAGVSVEIANRGFVPWAELSERVEKGDFEVGLIPLWHVPDLSGSPWTIAALTPRVEAAWKLLSPIGSMDTSSPHHSGLPSVLRSVDPKTERVLRRWFVDPEWEEAVEGSALDGTLVLDGYLAEASRTDRYELRSLSPQEFIPYAGAGVGALVCRRDHIELRTKLAQIHDAQTAICTNIERRLAIFWAEKGIEVLGIHVYRDRSMRYVLDLAFAKKGGGIGYRTWKHSTHSSLLEVSKEEKREWWV